MAEEVMKEVELKVKVLVPADYSFGEDPAKTVASVIDAMLQVARSEAQASPDDWEDDDSAEAVKVLGEITVSPVRKTYANVSWSVDDVQTKAEEKGLDLSDEEAEAFLHDNARQIESDMVDRGWDSIATLLDMGEYKEADGPGDEDEDEDDEFEIPAEAHTDDRTRSVDFDAVEWFEAATDDEIVALARESWCQCKEANDVAQHCAGEGDELDLMFEYLEKIKDLPSKKDVCGYECSVDEDAARAWLDEHRPHLILRIDNGDDNG